MGKDRHLFPGGNTPAGFFSYYQYILPQDKADHIYVVKGGPGVGKSTFMMKIGEAVGERGIAVDYLHCSSDPDSLDGIVIPELKTALIDGTAPHVVDPKNPGAVDEIINLGEYWKLSGIKEHRGEVLADNAEVGKLFARAYRYLGAAKKIYEDLDAIYTEHTDAMAADGEFAGIEHIFCNLPLSKTPGSARKLFASAITPDGLIHHIGTLIDGYQRVYILTGAGRQLSAFLKLVAAEAVRKGLDVEEYYCPMDPAEKLEHLLIPSLSVAFTTANRYHRVPDLAGAPIYFGKYLDRRKMAGLEESVSFDEEQLDLLLDKAVETLHDAKAMHDHMETYYVPNMDFDAISACRERILARILKTTG